jgi:DHA3 family macrolide efflux protein-like MFS transporter
METAVAGPSVARAQAIHHLLERRDFVLLFAGQLLSQIGDQCLLIAAITLISDLSASPLAFLIPALSMALPQVIFGMLGGVVADRWDRKWVMIAADLLRGLLVLLVLLVHTTSGLWLLYLAAAGLALMGVFFYPARNATIPNLVPNGLLLTANSLLQGGYLIALIVGPTVAGVIVDIWGLPSAIIFDSGTFVVSAAIIGLLRIPKNANGSTVAVGQRGVWSEMRAGLSFIHRNRPLRHALNVTAVATLGIGAIIILALPHLKARLSAGGLEYGGAISMLGVGSLIGGLIVTRLSRRVSASTIIGGMLVLAGAAIVAFAFATVYPVVLASVAVLGLCIVVARGVLDTITQALAPDEVRGRVQSAVNLVVQAGTVAAQGLSAFLGHFLGVQMVFVAAGGITVVAGVVAVFVLREAAALALQRHAAT